MLYEINIWKFTETYWTFLAFWHSFVNTSLLWFINHCNSFNINYHVSCKTNSINFDRTMTALRREGRRLRKKICCIKGQILGRISKSKGMFWLSKPKFVRQKYLNLARISQDGYHTSENATVLCNSLYFCLTSFGFASLNAPIHVLHTIWHIN